MPALREARLPDRRSSSRSTMRSAAAAPARRLVPRRLRRAAEKLERRQARPLGQIAGAGFLVATMLYALVIGGQIGRLGDSLLVLAGFGIEDVRIDGNGKPRSSTILEQLELVGSLVSFDVARRRSASTRCPGSRRLSSENSIPAHCGRDRRTDALRAVAARRRSFRHRRGRHRDRAAGRGTLCEAAVPRRRRRQRRRRAACSPSS